MPFRVGVADGKRYGRDFQLIALRQLLHTARATYRFDHRKTGSRLFDKSDKVLGSQDTLDEPHPGLLRDLEQALLLNGCRARAIPISSC